MAIQGNDGFWYNSQVDADAGNPSGRVSDDRSSSKSSGPSDGEQRSQEYRAWSEEFGAKTKAFYDKLSHEENERKKREDAEIESLTKQGYELILQQKYDSAIAILNKANSISGYGFYLGNTFAFLGKCYLEKGNLDDALKNLNIAAYSLSTDSEEKKDVTSVKINQVPSVFALRGIIFEKKGNMNQAIADFKMAANWDYFERAIAKEQGHQIGADGTGALKRLKMLGVEYTAQVPPLSKNWERDRPKDSSFTPISTADVKVSSSSSSQASSGVTCKQCGKALKEGAKFCGGCGTKVG
jgi:tetratricopeptide (TPR) repeat protein